MDAWMKWVIVLAGLVAVIGQWYTGYWLSFIGGIVAIIVGFMLK